MAKKRKNPSETMPEIFDDEEFGQFRYIKRGEEIWFVAVDLCRALDLENVTKALYPLADDETNTFTISKGIVGNPKMRFVNESGLYRSRRKTPPFSYGDIRRTLTFKTNKCKIKI